MINEKLKIIDHIPEGFLDIKPREITKIISSPTLLHLKGEKDQPFFISIILHGNEYSGLIILQKILKKYRNTVLPRSLIIFIGNPKACAQGVRHLKDQHDLNRIWKSGSPYEEFLTKPVLEYAKNRKVQAAIDIHNNTGRNPVYACINKKEEECVKLAQTFSKNIVYFTKPDSVLSIALSNICPAIVIECGLPGHTQGIAAGTHFIESILDKEEKWKKNKIKSFPVYHTFATLRIAPEATICFHPQPSLKEKHMCFIDHLDELNFQQLKPGTFLGKISDPTQLKLIDKNSSNIFNQFFSIRENSLTVKSSFIPGMLTKNIQIAKSDCLGYIMKKESINLES